MTHIQTPVAKPVPHAFAQIESSRRVYEGLLNPEQLLEWSQTRRAAVARECSSLDMKVERIAVVVVTFNPVH